MLISAAWGEGTPNEITHDGECDHGPLERAATSPNDVMLKELGAFDELSCHAAASQRHLGHFPGDRGTLRPYAICL